MFGESHCAPLPSENKKARSRRAAQSRRSHENHEFISLAEELPLSKAIVSQLDKATVVRLTMSYLNLRNFMSSPEDIYDFDDGPGELLKQGSRLLEAFDGFAFCLWKDLSIIYVSETVSIGLGLSQIDMLGLSFLDYVHPSDRHFVAVVMDDIRVSNETGDTHRRFSIRIKSNLVKRATKEVTEGVLGHKVVEFLVERRSSMDDSFVGVLGIGIPLPSAILQELPLETSSFVLTCSMDMRIQYSCSRAEEVLGKVDSSLRNQSIYSIIHLDDLDCFANFHMDRKF